jgi:hypothetical protein
MHETHILFSNAPADCLTGAQKMESTTVDSFLPFCYSVGMHGWFPILNSITTRIKRDRWGDVLHVGSFTTKRGTLLQDTDGTFHFFEDFISPTENPSPAELIVRAATSVIELGLDFDQKSCPQTDLRQACKSVEIILDSLCGLENEITKTHEDIIHTLGWYCYALYVQVLEGNWESIASIFRELSSDGPVRLGEQWAPSITENLVKLQATTATALMYDIWDCFSAALSAVPTDFPKRLNDAWEFGRMVTLVASGKTISELKTPWKEAAAQLDSKNFREKIRHPSLRIERFEGFVRRKVKLIGDRERICAEIRSEFARAEENRLKGDHETKPANAKTKLPANKTQRRILTLCRRKALSGPTIARKLELSPDHTRRVLAMLVNAGHLRNDEAGYRTRRAT